MRIFISHSHPDSALADALRVLYESIFGQAKVQVRYSSDLSPGGGIPSGTSWLEWIINEVKAADRTLVVLTPRSLDRPWLLWESGAVTGVALSNGAGTPVIPLLFKTSAEQVPSPLRPLQLLYGDRAQGVIRELSEVNALLNHLPEVAFNAVVNTFVPAYLASVESALADQPLMLSEGSVQEWVSRIELLRREERWADVDTLETALNLAFSPPDAKEPSPLDVRLHRHLGEIYLRAKRPGKAVEQFKLALKLMPRDVYLLHKLGLGYLEQKQVDSALEVLAHIGKLSSQLVEKDAEIGGLAGRTYRARWEATGDVDALRSARNAYMTVAYNLQSSYYAADVGGQLSLLLGETEKAKELLGLAKKRIEASGERSIWALSTLATANYVLGQPDQTVKLLAELAALRVAPRDLQSIKDGLKRLVDSQQASTDLFATWIKILDGAANA